MSRQLLGAVLTSGFCVPVSQIVKLNVYSSKLCFHYSINDDVVPFSEMSKFQELLPNASYHTYDNKNGHFSIEEFPEIVSLLRGT